MLVIKENMGSNADTVEKIAMLSGLFGVSFDLFVLLL